MPRGSCKPCICAGVRPARSGVNLLAHPWPLGPLRQYSRVGRGHRRPVAIHAADAGALTTGTNPPIVPRPLFAHVLRPFFQHTRIDPLEPDLLVNRNHFVGSLWAAGEDPAHPGTYAGLHFVAAGIRRSGSRGLAPRRGAWGASISAGRPGWPYFYEDAEQTKASVRRVLELPATRLPGRPRRSTGSRERDAGWRGFDLAVKPGPYLAVQSAPLDQPGWQDRHAPHARRDAGHGDAKKQRVAFAHRDRWGMVSHPTSRSP